MSYLCFIFEYSLNVFYKEHSKKLTPYLLQNDVVLYFESYWKQQNVADINFWDFNMLNDWASQNEKRL